MGEGQKASAPVSWPFRGASAPVKVSAMRARCVGASRGSATTSRGRGRMLAAGLALPLLTAISPMLASAPAGARVTSATVHTATAPPPAGIHYEEESLEAFEDQLRAADIAEAEINKVAHHLHLTLHDGRHQLVEYEGHQEQALQSRLLAAGVPVTIEFTTKSTKSSHHTLRYIAAGLLVAALIVLGVLLVARRRRLAQLEAQAGAGGQPASPGSE
jgi:hypothetical protein